MPATNVRSDFSAGNLLFRPTAAGGYVGREFADRSAGGPFGALVYTSTAASAAVSNTTDETAFNRSVTIPAGELVAGDVIRIRAQAIATATNSTDTLTLKAYVGSVEVATTGAVDVANNDIGLIDVSVVVRTAGASGTCVAAGTVALGAAGTVTAKATYKASQTLDTTAANAVTVKATWSNASSGNSVRLDVLTVELF